jgi:hypothetical protein
MAIFIFQHNLPLLYRIAENKDVMDQNKNFFDSEYDLVTVSQEDFNNIRLNKKTIESRVDNTVTLKDAGPTSFTEISTMQEHINDIISIINSYLVINPNKPMTGDIITYKNYLQKIELSTLPKTLSLDGKTVSFNSSMEEYCENQGIKAINLLQLL